MDFLTYTTRTTTPTNLQRLERDSEESVILLLKGRVIPKLLLQHLQSSRMSLLCILIRLPNTRRHIIIRLLKRSDLKIVLLSPLLVHLDALLKVLLSVRELAHDEVEFPLALFVGFDLGFETSELTSKRVDYSLDAVTAKDEARARSEVTS